MTAEVASVINLLVSWGLLAIIVINDNDDDDDDDDDDDVADYLNWSSKHFNKHFYYLMPDDDNNFSGSVVLDLGNDEVTCNPRIAAKVLDLGFHKLNLLHAVSWRCQEML